MEKLQMKSSDRVSELVRRIGEIFPNCVTERRNKNSRTELAIDFDRLRQELSHDLVEGDEERYRFTWPGKREAIRLANQETTLTLRPCREESVDFDTTENLYIEGDNLDVLKILRETYLGRVKMIYIDPPYNTGNDYVYNDDFVKSCKEFEEESDATDEDGNRMLDPMQRNTEANGRFHSDWLNMMYPRLKVARDLLSEDGVIFISIDDNEQENLTHICNETFGETNYIATIVRNTNSTKNQTLFVSVSHEYCLIYCKDINTLKNKHAEKKWSVPKNNTDEYLRKVRQLQGEGLSNEEITEELKTLTKYPRFIDFTNYWYFDERGLYRKDNLGGVKNGNMEPLFNPLTGEDDPVPPGGYRYSPDKLKTLVKEKRIHFHTDGSLPTVKRYLLENENQRPKSIMSDDQRPDYKLLQEFGTPFDNPKQLAFMARIVGIVDVDSIILDFFSGSATTAHAVMQLNAEDGGNRKFIMVQLPEKTDEKSEAYKAGYANICEIGKERIRRAGRKIREEHPEAKGLDTGFRVLKLDTSNMRDVFYTPDKVQLNLLSQWEDNIKEGRESEDLLMQVMLELGVELSAPIEQTTIAGKEVFVVGGDYLLACFDRDVTEETIEEMAKRQPVHLVIRDASAATDNVLDNFEQIIASHSAERAIQSHVL